MKYDFLIVGAGLFGATCARLLTDNGFKCLIIERDGAVGGLCATDRIYNIDVHLFGPHVFHTNNEDVWNFVNKYDVFNNYAHQPIAVVDNTIYQLPINMHVYNKLYNVKFPKELSNILTKEKIELKLNIPRNSEENAILKYGLKAYNILVKPYTEKLYNCNFVDIPNNIIDNLRKTTYYNNNYYTDKYQGIPIHGYTKFIENIIGDDIDIMLNKDFIQDRDKLLKLAELIIYTGNIDELCNYVYGPLKWATSSIQISDESEYSTVVTSNAVTYFPQTESKWYRITEHKFFTPERLDTDDEVKNHTIISYEYPDKWEPGKRTLYPINDISSNILYNRYIEFLTNNYPNIYPCGRGGEFKANSMTDTIKKAMDLCKSIIDNK